MDHSCVIEEGISIRPYRINEDYARSKAQMLLRQLKILEPPVPVLEIIKQYAKIKWHEDAGDGFTFYNPLRRKKYIISIDKNMVKGRITWTLGHELAHIILKHFIKYEFYGIDNLTEQEKKNLDREADVFAREFIMNEEWVRSYCNLPLTKLGLFKLKDKFNVSWKAMAYRLIELGICSEDCINQLYGDRRIAATESSEYQGNDRRKIRVAINFCANMIEEEQYMQITIPLPKTDNNGRFLECPVCGNIDFSEDAKYCKQCGFLLYNLCSNSENDPRDSAQWCGRPNASDALYCEYCGATTLVGQALQQIKSKRLVAATKAKKED